MGARTGEAERAIQVTGLVHLDDPQAGVMLVLGAQAAVVRAAILELGGKLKRQRARLIVARDLGVQLRVAEYQRLEPAVLGAALAHEHLAVAQANLRVDHALALRADAAGQLPEDIRPVDFLIFSPWHSLTIHYDACTSWGTQPAAAIICAP